LVIFTATGDELLSFSRVLNNILKQSFCPVLFFPAVTGDCEAVHFTFCGTTLVTVARSQVLQSAPSFQVECLQSTEVRPQSVLLDNVNFLCNDTSL
jgi:hypothetical protein